MSQLSDLRIVDPVLTELATGFDSGELIHDFLFPFVPMNKEAGKIPTFGKEAFKVYNTKRAIRGGSNRIKPEGRGTGDVVLEEHDLEYPIDYREDKESLFDEKNYGTSVVMGGIMTGLELQAANLARTLGNYLSTNRVTLSGTGKWSDVTTGASDPIAVIEAGKEAVRASCGRYPTKIEFGAFAWLRFKNHPKVLARYQYSQAAIITTAMAAELLGIPNVKIGASIYALDDDTNVDIWGDDVIMCYSPVTEPTKRSRFEPSFGYTFRKKGFPQMDTYVENGGKIELVRATDIFVPQIVGNVAGYLIKDVD